MSVDKTANIIVHGLYVGSWNEMISTAHVGHLQAMAKLWLMRKQIIDDIESLDYDQMFQVARDLINKIEALEDTDD